VNHLADQLREAMGDAQLLRPPSALSPALRRASIASPTWAGRKNEGFDFPNLCSHHLAVPSGLAGMEPVPEIAVALARRTSRAFGPTVHSAPARLREVDGIGPVRANRIVSAWAEQKAVREIMVFLHSHGVGTARAVRIFKTYGADAIQVMTENPYRLARDIRGIGFKTADDIAMKLGIEKTAMVRVRAGISYALTEAMDDGHCGLPTDELVPFAEKLLEVPQDLIRTALDLELQEGTVVADGPFAMPATTVGTLVAATRVFAVRAKGARVSRITCGARPGSLVLTTQNNHHPRPMW
jgi:hypothetical protein